jgi:hypothetical protein
MRWLEGLELVPAIKDIRSSMEQLRSSELERHRAWLAGLAPGERARIELMTRSLVNKLLHRVLSGLRDSQHEATEGAYAAAIARRLLCTGLNFGDQEVDDNPEADEVSERLNEAEAADVGDRIAVRSRRRK